MVQIHMINDCPCHCHIKTDLVDVTSKGMTVCHTKTALAFIKSKRTWYASMHTSTLSLLIQKKGAQIHDCFKIQTSLDYRKWLG